MAPTRTFTSLASVNPNEPITFTIEGVRASDPDAKWSETFTCVEVAPAGVLDDLISSVSTDSQGNMVFNAVSLLRFVTGVVIEADVARIAELSRDKDRLVDITTLGEIVKWLTPELTGRPTTPPSS